MLISINRCPICGENVAYSAVFDSDKAGVPTSAFWGAVGDRRIIHQMGQYCHIETGGEHRLAILSKVATEGIEDFSWDDWWGSRHPDY